MLSSLEYDIAATIPKPRQTVGLAHRYAFSVHASLKALAQAIGYPVLLDAPETPVCFHFDAVPCNTIAGAIRDQAFPSFSTFLAPRARLSLHWQIELLALHDLRPVDVEEVRVEHRLNQSSNDSNRIKMAAFRKVPAIPPSAPTPPCLLPISSCTYLQIQFGMYSALYAPNAKI